MTARDVIERFQDFCRCINFAKSSMNSEAIEFMNNFSRIILQIEHDNKREIERLKQYEKILNRTTTGNMVHNLNNLKHTIHAAITLLEHKINP
jgi:hypothetical protein